MISPPGTQGCASSPGGDGLTLSLRGTRPLSPPPPLSTPMVPPKFADFDHLCPGAAVPVFLSETGADYICEPVNQFRSEFSVSFVRANHPTLSDFEVF